MITWTSNRSLRLIELYLKFLRAQRSLAVLVGSESVVLKFVSSCSCVFLR